MKWQFWQKKPASFDDIEWPTDAFTSIKFLLDFFVNRGRPFSVWKSDQTTVAPEVGNAIRFAVQGLQLRTYFYIFEQRFGEREAELARDAFCLLLTHVNKQFGEATRWLLREVDRAADSAALVRKKVVVLDGKEVEASPTYLTGLYFLLNLPDSPCRDCETQADFKGRDWSMAECLHYGRDVADIVFNPMICALKAFDPLPFPEWAWRTAPGAFERHLQRRHNNPLFPSERRTVSTLDVLEARRKDDAEYQELLKGVKAIELPEELPYDWNAFLSDIRERIDALRKRAREVGGDTSKIRSYLDSLRDSMSEVWRGCMKGNENALKLFEAAEASAKAYDEQFRGEFGNQLLRKGEKSIPPADVIPALLCEDPKSVAAFYETLPEDNRKNLQKWVADIIERASKEGLDIMTVKEQLYALGWPRPACG